VENRTEDLTATGSVKTPEQIEQEMAQTRESLTEKVAALESQVVGSVQTAADTLTGTVDAVKSLVSNGPGVVTDTVREAATAVSESVKKVFDISGHVRDNPWTSVGVSTGLGFLTGLLVFRSRATALPPPSPMYAASMAPPAAPAASTGGGLFDDLIGMVGRKVKEFAETAIESATTAVNQTVRENVPKFVEAAAEHLTPNADHPGAGGRFSGVGGFRG